MRKALVRKVLSLAILTALFLLAGCAGQVSNTPGAPSQQPTAQDSPRTVAYKSLATANKTYTATMKSIADLCRQGLIDDQVKARSIKYGNDFKKAHDLAITAVEAGDYNSVAGVSLALAQLLDFVQPYLIKGGAK